MRRNAAKAVRTLEEEVTRLRAEVTSLKEAPPPPADPEDKPVSRRQLLRAAGTAAAAGLGLAMADGVLTPTPAAAAGPISGDSADAIPAVTGINAGSGVGVWGEVNNAASSNAGVYGLSNGGGAAIWGRATSTGGNALLADNTDPTTTQAVALIQQRGLGEAIHAHNSSATSATIGARNFGAGNAIQAQSQSGAPLWIVGSASPPSGLRNPGEVFFDGSSGSLCLSNVGGPAPGVWLRVGFNPIDPVRIVDTRPLAPPASHGDTPLAHGEELLVDIIGAAGIPAGASAVVLNATAVAPTATGFVSLYPANLSFTPGDPPTISNLNVVAGGPPTPNLAQVKIAPPGTTNAGKIKVFYFGPAGTCDVLLDVAGFFS